MLNTLRRLNKKTLADIREEMEIRRTSELFLLFSMGSQFDHLIKLRMSALGVFCLVADPSNISAKDVAEIAPKGIIISGGPASVISEPPPFDNEIFNLGIPVLGICLGFQMWAQHMNIPVRKAQKREFGTHILHTQPCSLFEGCPSEMPVLHSHGDRIESAFKLNVVGTTDNSPIAAATYHHLLGIQFHPEVVETEYGSKILENFCFLICGAKNRFPVENVAAAKTETLAKEIGNGRVLLALSGGSDSSVAAFLLGRAINFKPGILRGVYIRGVDRPDDEECVRQFFGNQPWIDLKIVDATAAFLKALKGKVGMKAKRLAMRRVYKPILEREAKLWKAQYIAQGTLYTDLCESGTGHDTGARRAQIKLHHNVNLKFSLPEIMPLSDQVKDTARNIGTLIGVPKELLTRHPFPGPGLIVRIEGKITAKKLLVARQADGIFIEELRRANLYDTTWQAMATLLSSETTCSKGDDAATGYLLRLKGVSSIDGFTARWICYPEDFLRHVSRRMTNEIKEVGGVVLGISDKPPETIELG